MAVTIQNANRCQSDKNRAEWLERSEGADPGTANSKRQQHKRAENIWALAREGLAVVEIARRPGIRDQHAYNVLKAQSAPAVTARAVKNKASLDLKDALVLVSCVSQKLSEPAPARLLYRSEWFTKVRTLVETQKAD